MGRNGPCKSTEKQKLTSKSSAARLFDRQNNAIMPARNTATGNASTSHLRTGREQIARTSQFPSRRSLASDDVKEIAGRVYWPLPVHRGREAPLLPPLATSRHCLSPHRGSLHSDPGFQTLPWCATPVRDTWLPASATAPTSSCYASPRIIVTARDNSRHFARSFASTARPALVMR